MRIATWFLTSLLTLASWHALPADEPATRPLRVKGCLVSFNAEGDELDRVESEVDGRTAQPVTVLIGGSGMRIEIESRRLAETEDEQWLLFIKAIRIDDEGKEQTLASPQLVSAVGSISEFEIGLPSFEELSIEIEVGSQ